MRFDMHAVYNVYYLNWKALKWMKTLNGWEEKCILKVIVTVKSSGCLHIDFGPLIIDYICNFFI